MSYYYYFCFSRKWKWEKERLMRHARLRCFIKLIFLPLFDQETIFWLIEMSPDDFLTRRTKLLPFEFALPILFIQDLSESNVIKHELNQHILKILILYTFVPSPFSCIICDILTVLQTSIIRPRNFKKGNVGLQPPLLLLYEPSAFQPVTKTWVLMLPVSYSTLPGCLSALF